MLWIITVTCTSVTWEVGSDLCVHLPTFPLMHNQSADIGLWSCGWLPRVWYHNQISVAHSYLHDLLRNLLLSKPWPYNSVLLSRNSSHQYCLAGEWCVSSTRAKSASQQLPFLGMQNCIYQYVYVQVQLRIWALSAMFMREGWKKREPILMQSHAAREWSGLRSCYSLIGFIQWPSCYQSKSYNVHTMCLLVTSVS